MKYQIDAWELDSLISRTSVDVLNWRAALEHFTLPEWFIDKWIWQVMSISNSYEETEQLWRLIWIHQQVNEEFIKTNLNYVEWFYVLNYQYLSEEFLIHIITTVEDFQHNPIHWLLISQYCTLSEDFIRQYKDLLNWEFLIHKQNMSDAFRTEMQLKGYIY